MRHSAVPGRGKGYRRCSCSLLNTSQSTRPRTSGSRCHSSVQSNISSCHTHTSGHQLVRIPPYFACRSCKACRILTPWVCQLKKKRKTRDIGGIHPLEWSPFQIRDWNCGSILKRKEKNILVIDCQTVLNIAEVSSHLVQNWLQCCLMISPNSLTNF